MATIVDSEQVKAAVRETYGRIATEERSAGCCGSTGCCGPGAEATSDALGYMAFGFGLPAGAVTPHIGASCVVQTADDVVNTLFLSNPSPWILGF